MQRFKSILIGMLAVAFVGTVFGCKEEAVAASTDWKKSELNWNVEWNQSGYDVGLNVRTETNTLVNLLESAGRCRR